jgi:uncharacterized protein
MPLVLDENQAAYQIHAYKPGFIQVNETTLTQSIIVSTSQLITDWAPQTLSELTAEDLKIMDTSAACRTYNALTAESRNVVAALIIK